MTSPQSPGFVFGICCLYDEYQKTLEYLGCVMRSPFVFCVRVVTRVREG